MIDKWLEFTQKFDSGSYVTGRLKRADEADATRTWRLLLALRVILRAIMISVLVSYCV